MGGIPTIREVAVAADVAIGTVSRVLNGHKSVSDDVRRRVLKAIKKLKYEPDRVAQSMRLGVTRTVAFATRDISIPGFGAIVNAAEEALRSNGYTLLLAMTDERKERELNLLRIFQQRRVDAVIMATSSEDDTELSKRIRSADIPIVLLDRENPLQLDAVTLDHRRGIRAATEYLRGFGHTRIALLTGNPSTRPAHERIAGFKEASSHLGKHANHSIIRTGAFSAEFGFREASSLLSGATRPTAIIAGGMAMLAGVLQAVRARGLKIPDDVSVIAGADSDLAALATPSITAVRWSGTDEGRMAVQLLLNRLGNRSAPVQRVMISTELIPRESCGPPTR
ncbi:MAG: LacI family DNA-binding transcriptional regulator [Alphaproteobacteria bacterium]|nr:LacI family DNA-binding transcriptional regulator [Alphaproteobacteria bacterium]